MAIRCTSRNPFQILCSLPGPLKTWKAFGHKDGGVRDSAKSLIVSLMMVSLLFDVPQKLTLAVN